MRCRGDGGHALSLSHPGVNVPGATVTVTLSGEADYKGMLLFAEVDGRLAGAWGDDLPEGVQAHPHCKQTVTHDTYHVGGLTHDAIPWIVPENLADGTEVVFKATVVRDYATWCASRAAFPRHAADMQRAGLLLSARLSWGRRTAPAPRPSW